MLLDYFGNYFKVLFRKIWRNVQFYERHIACIYLMPILCDFKVFFCFLLYYQRKMLRPVCNLHLTETKFFWKGDSALREKASKDPRFAKYLSRVSLHPLDYVTIVHDACYTKTVLASSIKARRPCHSRDNDRWCMLRIGFCDDNDQNLFFEMKRKQNIRNDKT